MSYYLGLVLLSACISLSWAEDFSLTFSQEIIKAADQQPNELDGLPLSEPEKPADTALIPLKQEETSPPQVSEPQKIEKTPESPRQSVTSGLRDYSARSKQPEPVNQFLPIQAVPANQFFGQEMFADNPRLANDLLYVDGQNPLAIDPLAQLHDEMRLMVGEEVYAKMVWTYLDAKQLDDWIQTTISQSELFAEDSLIVGLNDQLMASLTSLGLAGTSGQNKPAPEPLNSRQSGELNPVKPAIDPLLMKADFESRSIFFGLLNYLTLGNFLYLMLSVMGLIYTGKLFKFLVRQQ